MPQCPVKVQSILHRDHDKFYIQMKYSVAGQRLPCSNLDIEFVMPNVSLHLDIEFVMPNVFLHLDIEFVLPNVFLHLDIEFIMPNRYRICHIYQMFFSICI